MSDDDDETYYNLSLRMDELEMIEVAIVDYGKNKLGVEFPREVTHHEITRKIKRMSQLRRIELFMDITNEMKHSCRDALLRAKLKESKK
jgi:sRNA-binding carbon storage regulator CsrA